MFKSGEATEDGYLQQRGRDLVRKTALKSVI